MARQRRDLDDHFADIFTMARGSRTNALTTPAMAPVGPNMIEDNAVNNEHIAHKAVALENLDDEMQSAVASLAENQIALGQAQEQLDTAQERLDSLFQEVATLPTQESVTAAQQAALEAAKAYTDANAGGGVTPEELESLRLDAQVKADAARDAAIAAAGSALADAQADTVLKMAQVANSKNATFYGPDAPTATKPKGTLAGDTYRRRNTAGNIIGEWEWVVNASGVGSWAQRKMTSESMTAVDIGVLSAGSAVIDDAVARTIAAGTAAFQKADIGNLIVTGNSNLNTLAAERIAANVGAYLKLYASQVIVGEPGNIFPDPNFSDPEGWQLTSGYTIDPAGGRNGNAALVLPAGATQTGRYYGANDRRRQFRVTGGSRYRATVWAKPDGAAPINSLAIYGKWTNPSTAVSGGFAAPNVSGNTAAVAAGAWVQITHEFTVPQEATHALIGLYAQAAANTRVVFSEPVVKELITPSLVVDGIMDGKRIIGARVETNAASDVGVKLKDGELASHGKSSRREPVLGSEPKLNTYAQKAIITARPAPWSQGAADVVPGLWFEGQSIVDTGATPPLYKAGVQASDADARGVRVSSSQVSDREAGANVIVDPGVVSLSADGVYSGGNTQTNSSSSLLMTPGALAASALTNGMTTARLDLDASGVHIAGGLTVDGVDYSDTGWRFITYQNNWANYNNGFIGLRYKRLNGVVFIQGTIKGGAVYSIIGQLPPDFRPKLPTGIEALEFPITAQQSGVRYSGTLFVYATGSLRYDAPPGVWSGADRVSINSSFPII